MAVLKKQVFACAIINLVFALVVCVLAWYSQALWSVLVVACIAAGNIVNSAFVIKLLKEMSFRRYLAGPIFTIVASVTALLGHVLLLFTANLGATDFFEGNLFGVLFILPLFAGLLTILFFIVFVLILISLLSYITGAIIYFALYKKIPVLDYCEE